MKAHVKANLKDGSSYEVDIETTLPDEVAQVSKAIAQLLMGELIGKIKDVAGVGFMPHDCWTGTGPDLMKDRIDNLKKMEDLK